VASSVVDDVKDRLSAVELIGRTVQLKQAGRNHRGLCPFHSEKTPSFFVFPESNNYKCFGCGEGGDIFTFTMKTQNLEFREALVLLSEQSGIKLDDSPGSTEQAQIRKHLLTVNEAAAAYFRLHLNESGDGLAAINYVQSRGLNDIVSDQFQLGYSPKDWDSLVKHMQSIGFTVEDLITAGLARESKTGQPYDYFRNRIMFPIHNGTGHLVGFGARSLNNEEPKYLNSPQTPIFDKGAELYALSHAKPAINDKREVVVVEGYMDAITAHQFGFDNVVASMGTAVSPKQVKQISRLAGRIVLALDADPAGQAATRRALESLRQENSDRLLVPLVQNEARLEAEILVAQLPDHEDPDSLIRSDNSSWESCVESAMPLADYLIRALAKDHNLNSFIGQAGLLDDAAPIINSIQETSVKLHYLRTLSKLVNMPDQTVETELIRRRNSTATPKRQSEPEPVNYPDDYLLALGLRSPKSFCTISRIVHAEDYSTSENRLLADLLARIGMTDESDPATAIRDELDSTLADRLDTVIRLMGKIPSMSAEKTFDEMQRIAYQLRRNGLRSENQHLQALQADGQSVRSDEALARWQTRILTEMREIQDLIRQKFLGR